MVLVNETDCRMSLNGMVSEKITDFPSCLPFHSFQYPLNVPMYQLMVTSSLLTSVTCPIKGFSLYLSERTATMSPFNGSCFLMMEICFCSCYKMHIYYYNTNYIFLTCNYTIYCFCIAVKSFAVFADHFVIAKVFCEYYYQE